jgi:hypothetical protein
MPAHIPSLATLESNDDSQLSAELRLARLRSQVAVVRALADHIDHFARPADSQGLGEQVIEEMARLGCRLLEAAGSMTRSSLRDESGVFARSSIEPTGSRIDSVAH